MSNMALPQKLLTKLVRTVHVGVKGRHVLGSLPTAARSTASINSTRSASTASVSPYNIPKTGPVVEHSNLPDVEIPTVPFTQNVMDKFGEYGDAVALHNGITGEEITYAQLQTAVSRVGSALVKRGYKQGDVATLFSPNCPEFATFFMGLAAIGGVVSAVNPVYTADELLHALDHSSSRAVVTVPALLETAKQAAARSKTCKEVIVFGEGEGAIPFSVLMNDDGSSFPTSVDIKPHDLMALPYSSGTTGLPKGVMLTNYCVNANIEQLRHEDALGYRRGDVFIGVLPFFHIYGQVVVLFTGLVAGAKIVTLPSFEPERFLQLIEEHKASFLHIAPPLALFLAKHPLVSQYDLTTIDGMLCGAAPLGEETALTMAERIKLKSFRQGYGLTEMSPVSHLNPKGTSEYGSIGFPLSNTECKIVDISSGETLGIDQDGELCLKGPQMMKGYLNNEQATADTIDSDGWLHTGDIGHIKENGHVYIVDRLKELIKYKGYQVAPAELEHVLLQHPAILDSAVIGIPDERAGELPRAYIVLKPNQKATEEEINSYLQGKVAPYKQLTGGIDFRAEIPKSASGKILRRLLKEEYLGK